MNPDGHSRFRLFASGVVPLALAGSAFSQTPSLEDLIGKSQVAMEAKQWAEALSLNRQAILRYGKGDPFKTFGPQFGAIHYRKGICEMKLKQWREAMSSFEICYRDFPNKGGTSAALNQFQKLALLKWGEAAMGAEEWELAISRFQKFSEERNRERDTFPQGSFHVSLAICHYKLGHIALGNENLEIAIRNKENFPTPEVGIVAAFQELVRACVTARKEQALLDFIGKNRGELIIDPMEMRRYSGVFLKLAGDALAADMRTSALAVYQFVPFDGFGADSPDIVKLAGVALIHEKCGNTRGALAAYLQLEENYPLAANRAENLYQLVRVASLLGDADLARAYALRLFGDFPTSPRLEELKEAGTDFPAEEIAARLKPALRQVGDFTVLPLPTGSGFPQAIDLYQARKYIEAKEAFQAIRKAGATAETADRATVSLATYYQSECLRKMGDLAGWGEIVDAIEKLPELGDLRKSQLDLAPMWRAFSGKNWEELDKLARDRTKTALPGELRAQVAYCRGAALENLGRSQEALDSYNLAMTADPGTAEDVARLAALSVLRFFSEDAAVRNILENPGNGVEDGSPAPGASRLREAMAVTELFESSLGCGTPLPTEFSKFRKAAKH